MKYLVPLFLVTTLSACSFTLTPLNAGEQIGEPDIQDIVNAGNGAEDGNAASDLSTNVQLALNTGQVDTVTTSELAEAIFDQIDSHQVMDDAIRQALFSSLQGPLTWNPSHDAAVLSSTPGMNFSVLNSNEGDTPQTLGIAGLQDETPYLVFGSNPFRLWGQNSDSANESLWQFMAQSIQWLTGQPANQLSNVVLSHLDDSYYFRDYPRTVNWLNDQTSNQVTVNAYGSCENAALAGCLTTSTDLLIISQAHGENVDAVVAGLQRAFLLGIPVLYVHWDGGLTDLGAALLNELAVAYVKDNYWSKHKITDVSASDLINNHDETLAHLTDLIHALETGVWDFTLNTCDSECRQSGAFMTQFLQPAQEARARLIALDKSKQPLFERDGFEIDKMLLLLADKYRTQFQFPLDAATSDDNQFLRTYFADLVQYLNRSSSSIPGALGNFGRTTFPNAARTNKTITLKAGKPFRAAGVYAFPGEGFTVTRTDNNPMTVKVFVNTQRTGATHEFDKNGYTRPKYLRSTSFSLSAGESITLSAPYGGPVQIEFPQNTGEVQLAFQNIGLHPYWNGAEDDQSFTDALTANQFDWAEIATPGFEVHSQKVKMDTTVARNPLWPNPAQLAQATMTFTHNYPHIVAGYEGAGIDRIAEITDFIESKGFVLSELTGLKHMNADQATCGYGCSGNPYDAYWAFNPIGHGDIHELGHGLEKSRFRFETKNGSRWEVHTTTNIYSYYSKSRYYAETGQDHSCQNLPWDTLYRTLQTAQASADPFTTMANNNLTSWNMGVATYIQFMMAAEASGALQNGWHLWGRLHALERIFSTAINNDDLWLAKRDALGFSNYTRTEARAVGNNDWMLISLSVAADRDYREFMELYGISVSSKALSQLNALNYARLPAAFYGANGNDYCEGLDKPTLPLDGTSTWPSPAPMAIEPMSSSMVIGKEPHELSDHPFWMGSCEDHTH